MKKLPCPCTLCFCCNCLGGQSSAKALVASCVSCTAGSGAPAGADQEPGQHQHRGCRSRPSGHSSHVSGGLHHMGLLCHKAEGLGNFLGQYCETSESVLIQQFTDYYCTAAGGCTVWRQDAKRSCRSSGGGRRSPRSQCNFCPHLLECYPWGRHAL